MFAETFADYFFRKRNAFKGPSRIPMTAFYIGFFRRLLLDCNFSARNFESGLFVFRLKIDNFMFLCFRQVGKKVEFSVAVMEFYVFYRDNNYRRVNYRDNNYRRVKNRKSSAQFSICFYV